MFGNKVDRSLAVDTHSNAIKTHPYAHPQYVKVVKHFYVFDNEVGVILNRYSLNNHTLLLFAPREFDPKLGNFQRLIQ